MESENMKILISMRFQHAKGKLHLKNLLEETEMPVEDKKERGVNADLMMACKLR